MKFFKKKRFKLPRQGAVERMILRRLGRQAWQRYVREKRIGREIPLPIREVTLARLHSINRDKIVYYPDLRNFQIVYEPNRTLPIKKFLDMFRGMIEDDVLEATHFALTNYRLEIYNTVEDWIRVYEDENVHSCMSGHSEVRCYIHPENKLALAALYAPGGNRVIARTIINTEDSWYVRLFGDVMLVNRLMELGYSRLTSAPREFKMYGISPRGYDPARVLLPYFDFPFNSVIHHPETYDPETQMFEISIS